MSNTSKSLKVLEDVIEESTGKSVEEIRSKTIDQHRQEAFEKGKSIKFISHKPFIGRGNVVDNFISHEEVEEMLDKCLR